MISTDAALLGSLASFPTNYMNTMKVLDVSVGYEPCTTTSCTDAIYGAMQTGLGK